jgi:hypothetical protein
LSQILHAIQDLFMLNAHLIAKETSINYYEVMHPRIIARHSFASIKYYACIALRKKKKNLM